MNKQMVYVFALVYLKITCFFVPLCSQKNTPQPVGLTNKIINSLFCGQGEF